ncbi:MAG TPA: ABC transporter permease subunit [Planctomycetota bacterium]|nr:ABC transporter permease subunit [Planctomycetota bacterium]
MSALAIEGRSPTQLAIRRFAKNRRAMAAFWLVLAVGLSTPLVPLLSPHDYRVQKLEFQKRAPDATYWFGTDPNGRDLMVRSFYGGQISFAVGLLATVVSLVIGVAYGATSGFLGGKIDSAMMRFVDILYGLPHMFLVIIVMSILGRNFLVVFMVLGCFSWMTMSRIVRGQVLGLKEKEFVEAARGLGVATPAIIARHMIPNILGPVIVYSTLTVPTVMLQEAFLSFLGLGISEPATSWGLLISDGAGALNPIRVYWWLVVFPGALLALTLFCLNAVGDGLRDAFDVQQR